MRRARQTSAVPGDGGTSNSGVHSAFDVARRLQYALRTAEVAPVVFIRAKGEDFFFFGGEMQIGGNDGKGALLFDLREDARREDVNAGKGQSLNRSGRANQFRLYVFSGLSGATAA